MNKVLSANALGHWHKALDAEKQQAFEALAGIVERIVSGAQAGVVQLKRKR